MKKAKTLLENAARDLEASPRTSTTSAGQTDSNSPETETARIEAINQVFALFRLNFHNQYYSAFPDETQLGQIKKLWLEALVGESPETTLRAARHCIEESDYLPTLHRFLESCRHSKEKVAGLPDARAAYREACLAPQPKAAQVWAHPAVYYAGLDVGWFYLASTTEQQAFPMFEAAYRRLCARVTAGERLSMPEIPVLPRSQTEPTTAQQRRQHVQKLRLQTGFN